MCLQGFLCLTIAFRYDIIPNCAGVPAKRKKLGSQNPLSVVSQENEAFLILTEMKTGPKVVGVKQTKRALNDGKVLRVFLAGDADPRVTEPVEALSAEQGVDVVKVPSMKELGSACGIAVGSAVAALLR